MTARKMVYRWDLDKTYLRTDFDSIRDIVRTAFETPGSKKTFPGARALLNELQAESASELHILSGSPHQMRKSIEAKLRLDGIDYASLTLKPTVRNILRGRFRYVRGQLAYKLGSLLRSRLEIDVGCDEILFGDDAEADAFVYSLYADVLSGRVSEYTLRSLFQRAGVYADDEEELLSLARAVPKRDAVRLLFINLERLSSPEMFEAFGDRVCPTFNYFQSALALHERRVLSAESCIRVGAQLLRDTSMSPDALVSSLRDLVRRRLFGSEAAQALIDTRGYIQQARFGRQEGGLLAFVDLVSTIDIPMASAQEPMVRPIDYVAMFSRDRYRAKTAKHRAKVNW